MVVQHLGYDSVKCIFKYMEANKRFEISQRIPSLRNIDRIVPLSIDTLVFSQNEVKVNDVNYRLGIIQCSPNASIPDLFQPINSTGGVHFDLDQFGFQDRHSDRATTPGDIAITKHLDPTTPPTHLMREEYLVSLEKRLQKSERGLREAEEGSEEQITYKQSVDMHRRLIMPYYYQRDNTPSPYERFIQLTITKKSESGEEIKKEMVDYSKKLGEAFKYLTTLLFGNRKFAINVRKLEIDHDPIVLRLPENLKLNVKELDVNCFARLALNALPPLLQDSSFGELTVYSITKDDLSLEQVKNSKCLVIKELVENQNWRKFMRRLQNQNVRIESDLPAKDYMDVIKYWKKVGKSIGTCYTFYVNDREEISELKKMLEFEEVVSSVRSKIGVTKVHVIVIAFKQLKIKITIEDKRKAGFFEKNSLWELKFEVIE